MKIEWLKDGYTDHGCKILPTTDKRVGMVNYYPEVKNHEFNGAYKQDGLFDCLKKAKELVKAECKNVEIELAIPDLVFRCDRP